MTPGLTEELQQHFNFLKYLQAGLCVGLSES